MWLWPSTRFESIYGRGGPDNTKSLAGGDAVYGENGDDDLFAGEGDDRVCAGAGNNMDRGEGNETVYSDAGDTVRSREVIRDRQGDPR